jgi:UDP-N-acetylmuramoyl-tripeptide--D-alanyl-D-alanine ligase
MKLTLYEVAKVVGAKNTISEFDDVPLRQIEFDSRKIEKGDLFLPLKGACNGHDFIETAFENGAVATFSERDVEGHPYILVDDCLEAFQALASYYLEKQRVDVIAVTGSNGKTTTKDMIAAVLSTEYKTYKTQGNYNNEIGLPYTALHMPDDTEKIVLEMGQDHMGDIHLLSELAKPHIGVVTLIGEAHLEFFGSREKIAKGKLQIVDGMDSDGILIAPADSIVDPYLPESQMVIRFGDGDDGKLLAISDDDIVEALENIELTRNRTEWKKAANGADILSDVYNANPTAMRLILETFSKIPANEGGKKIAVLADMKELGEQSVELHRRMIMSLSPETLDTLIFYGEDIAELAQLASQMFPLGKVYYFKKTADEDQFEDMLKTVKTVLQPADQILLKGSNSMHLAKVVEALEN